MITISKDNSQPLTFFICVLLIISGSVAVFLSFVLRDFLYNLMKYYKIYNAETGYDDWKDILVAALIVFGVGLSASILLYWSNRATNRSS